MPLSILSPPGVPCRAHNHRSSHQDHCADCVDRYCVDTIVRRGKVVALTPVPRADGAGVSHTRATLADGTTLDARRVVVGIGSTNIKRLPPFAPQNEGGAAGGCAPPAGRVMHAWDLVEAATRAGAAGGRGVCMRHRARAAAAAGASSCSEGSGGSGSLAGGGASSGMGGSPSTLSVDRGGSQSSGAVDDGGCTSPATAGGDEACSACCTEAAVASPLVRAGLVGEGEHVVIVGGEY
jgi:hypothetical protein